MSKFDAQPHYIIFSTLYTRKIYEKLTQSSFYAMLFYNTREVQGLTYLKILFLLPTPTATNCYTKRIGSRGGLIILQGLGTW